MAGIYYTLLHYWGSYCLEKEKKEGKSEWKANFDRSTTAGLRNEKQKLKKEKEERSENLFSKYASYKG